MNKVYLIGNLTRDPELSTTNSGVSVCRFSVAVSRRFANADGTRETDFFNVTAWRNTADICSRFLKKGSKVAVNGSIQTRNFERQDGTKGFAVDIIADEVEFLTRSESNGESGEGNSAGGMSTSGNGMGSAPVADLQPVDDNLPF